MRKASTYLSLAHNEGGPIPLMEALASGTPVVATSTGFSPDLINSSNGVLIPKSPDLSETREAILYAMSLKPMVEQADLLEGKYDWKDLGNLLYSKERMLN
jgi:glycosyltransferase involved in cell wall biosynthesis